jgi:hypothetical protein
MYFLNTISVRQLCQSTKIKSSDFATALKSNWLQNDKSQSKEVSEMTSLQDKGGSKKLTLASLRWNQTAVFTALFK